MNIPFIGDVTTTTLILAGITGLIGYLVGSSLRSALKIALIVVAVVFVVGFVTPEMVRQLAETITALKPLYETFFSGSNFTGGTLGFLAGFAIGFLKG
jgi:uncharacterized membrane protein (Fun14 family)